ncbi:lytic transglycosylase domain-containing protein [Urechidicola croceus]|uniref:Lytic transglycosylase n=1 Tax=Urechidicola croceus TaxID=1850246 RepID=A0A1D8P919_9FLAO|nr:lytic transglycosylase domain-containing protein [Urechidicola croceus]AOW21066.1 lytic transglycosylase [Urechidicola croceus]
MKKNKIYIALFLIFFTTILYAQDSLKVQVKDSLKVKIIELKDNIQNEVNTLNAEIIVTNNDTIIADDSGLKEYAEVTLIDSLWLKELYNSPLYDSIQYVMDISNLADVQLEELPTELLKERLAILDSETPFNVEYNQSLERLIKTYLKTRKRSYSTLMSRAQYYFPLFEQHLDNYDIPLEIKYLAIVESALKPRAKSRVGATGLWQFMYQTGKQFDLNVSSYVDERQDPLKATEAACKYLSALYKIFGDWDLALAAYNSEPGNVNKAIRRSGGQRNYWNIRQYLPRETAGYVPAFYATLYIFKYADTHGIISDKAYINQFETDTIHVKQQITFEQINKFLDVDLEMIQFLNPQYKLDIIPYVKGKDYYVRLPLYNIGQYVTNEKEMYAFVDAEEAKREKSLPQFVEMKDQIRYRVVSGDYLGKIANKYGVSVSSIKRWNGLRSNHLKIGQRLTIYPRKIANATPQKQTNSPTVKGDYSTYVVQKGDSLWTISQKYSNVSVQNLKEWNNIWSVKSLKPGMKLKIFKS